MRTFPPATLFIATLNYNHFFQGVFGLVFHPRVHHQATTKLPTKTQNYYPQQQRQQRHTDVICRSSILDDFNKEYITIKNENDSVGDSLISYAPDKRGAAQEVPPKKNRLSPPKTRVFKHLYRYFTDISVECWLATVCPAEFLSSCGFTKEKVKTMSDTYPKLFSSNSINVRGHLAPKVRFLVHTLGGGHGDICSGLVEEECISRSIDNNDDDNDCDDEMYCPHNLQLSEIVKSNVPPKFFGMALEKTVAPRHAYLVYHSKGLPHGRELLENDAKLFKEFVDICERSDADFVELCNQWSSDNKSSSSSTRHTIETYEAFSRVFCSGIMSTARNENLSDLVSIQCAPGKMASLQLLHGANPIETDRCGVAPLHWLAGTGNVEGTRALLNTLVLAQDGGYENVGDILLNSRKAKGGATALHWACAGVRNKQFGCGGYVDICELLLNEAGAQKGNLANAETTTGSTPLMWASWAGSLDVVKLLLKNNVSPNAKDENGANAADWALYSGNVEICKYLNEEFGIECSKFGP